MSPQEQEPILPPSEDPLQPELFPEEETHAEPSAQVEEGEFVYESFREYLTAYREGRRQQKARKTRESSGFRDGLKSSVEAKINHSVNVDEPEPQTPGDERLQRRVHRLLRRRSQARSRLASLEKSVPPHEAFHPYKLKGFELKKRRAAKVIERSSAKALREVRKSVQTTTGSPTPASQAPSEISQPDSEQLSLRFSKIPIVSHSRGELFSESEKKPTVFESFLPASERTALLGKRFKEFEQAEKEKEEKRRKPRKSDGTREREIRVPKEIRHLFDRDTLEASYDKIEDAIQAGKLARLAELNEGKPAAERIKEFPREELGDIVAAARRAEIQELLGDDYSETNERALMAAFTAVHKERMKRSREEAED